jgi:hypothetical protein
VSRGAAVAEDVPLPAQTAVVTIRLAMVLGSHRRQVIDESFGRGTNAFADDMVTPVVVMESSRFL